ncbi:MAG: metal ABC transporter ATP-binding protein [Verrucomicrobia bacterium]|nr:metal ABC transporter ATP-binding protein [Verrucomicrobiota bacterium]
MTPNILEVEQLTVNYEKTSVLWDINFAIPEKKIVGILGPNGAGKSTLLKTLLGLLQPLSGQISFFGKPLSQVRKKVGYVPQRSSVDWDFPITAFDLVMMGRYGKMGLLKWASKEDKEATRLALEQVEMLSFANRQIGELSGGQQQRLFIARALVQDADIYLLDEPFAGIDMATEKTLVDLFRTLREKGKTLLIVHHNLASTEQYFDWLILLNTCLIASGPVEEVFNQQNIWRTYGRSSILLDEAAIKAKNKTSGLV